MLDEHRQVDGVEVSIAAETVTEVSLRRLLDQELTATRVRTKEEEVPLPVLVRPAKAFEQGGYRNLISDPAKIVTGEVFAQLVPPYGSWNSWSVC